MKKFILSLIISYSAGVIGGFFTAPAIDGWYSALIKPFFNPPNWIFGPVWGVLYFLIGVSLYLLWKKMESSYDKKTFRIFLIQIFFNGLWSITFFGLQQIELALVNIVIVLATIFVLITRLKTNHKVSAYLLIPYLYWVGFATILNLAIVVLN